MDKTRDELATKKLFLGVLFAVLTYAAGRIAGMVCLHFGLDTMMIPILVRSLFAVVFIFMLGGGEMLRFDWRAMVGTWKFVLPLIIINILLGGLTVVGVIANVILGDLPLENSLRLGIYVTVLCFFVGVNEEGMFRGLMLNGLLAKWGRTNKGVLWAAIVSSIVFGAVHVMWDVNFTNGWSMATGFMKTLETSMFAFIFCYPVIKHDTLWGAMTAHGFFDWIILFGNTIATGEMSAPSYVATDPEIAKAAIAIFAIMAVLYLPRTIRAAKEILAMPMPQTGPFMGEEIKE